MDKNELAIWLSIVATAISILSFFTSSFIAAWRAWREKARLRFAVSKVIQKNSDGNTFNQVQIKISNIGLSPITLTGFKAIADNGSYHMGDNDPTAAAYGIELDVFPAHLSPGGTIKFYPVSIEELKANQTDPKNPKQHYSPWTYFVVVDNFGKYHHMYVQDVLRALHMVTAWSPRTKCEKVMDFISRKRLFRKVKKQRF